jgi:putative ABC transport system ATP-binding protein
MPVKEPEAPIVQVENLGRTYGSGPTAVRALSGINLGISRGSLTVLLGRSGSGKTSLLNLLGGLDRPTEGRVLFDGVELSSLPEPALTLLRRRRIGYVFQSFALLPLLTARENVELPLRMAGVSLQERRRRAGDWLAYVGLAGRSEHRPYELSGGEQQRVALARALVLEPALILADEPTGQLDTATAWAVVDLLKRAARETGAAVCMTTHDPAIVEVADRRFVLHDGRLEQEGSV